MKVEHSLRSELSIMKRSADEEVCESAGKKACNVSVAEGMVRPSVVPEYLRESEFYKSLILEDDEEFYVPAHLMKADTSVNTMEDAVILLQTMRFWGVETKPLSVAEFAFCQPFKEVHLTYGMFKNELPYVESILGILNAKKSRMVRTVAAMELGVVEIVRLLHDTGEASYTEHAVAAAAGSGDIDCLKHALHYQKVPHNIRSLIVYRKAVANGRLECIKLLTDLYLSLETGFGRSSIDDGNLAVIAAGNGQEECLRFLHEKGCCLFNCAEPAAARGSLSCLQYVVERRQNGDRNFGLHVCVAAAQNDHYPCLKYLLEHGYPTSEKLCVLAAASQRADCLHCAHSHGSVMCVEVGIVAAGHGSLSSLRYFYENGGVWGYEVCHAAALSGHLHCLKYAYEHGCPLMPCTGDAVVIKRYCRKFHVSHGPSYIVEQTAMYKHWSCVLYLILQGCPLTRGLTAQLAYKHKDNILQLAVERGCEVGVRYSKVGNLEGLKFALEHGCDPSPGIPVAAARRGHLHCLTYAHQQGGCDWSAEVCVAAARGGHLDCLQYAREYGCPWDCRVRVLAKTQGHDEVVRYADEHDCPDFVERKVGMQVR